MVAFVIIISGCVQNSTSSQRTSDAVSPQKAQQTLGSDRESDSIVAANGTIRCLAPPVTLQVKDYLPNKEKYGNLGGSIFVKGVVKGKYNCPSATIVSSTGGVTSVPFAASVTPIPCPTGIEECSICNSIPELSYIVFSDTADSSTDDSLIVNFPISQGSNEKNRVYENLKVGETIILSMHWQKDSRYLRNKNGAFFSDYIASEEMIKDIKCDSDDASKKPKPS